MFDRVLILTVDIGGGHMRAAQALEKVFYRLEAARDVRIADAMQYTGKLFWRLFERAYRDMVVNAPHLYGWLYERSNAPGRVKRPLFYEKLNTRRLRRLLEGYRPELVISTHVVPAGILSWTKEKEGIDTPHAMVITDFDVHVVALCGPCDHYFVALEETQAQLEALGVAAGNITVAGIPIDPAFLDEQDKAEARRQLGLDPDLTTILVTSGGWGLGPVEQLVQAFQGLSSPAQVVALCGHNEQLKRNIERIIRGASRDSLVELSCIGWTDRMHVYMSAADLIAGKTGGLTTSEALAKGLPFFVVNPLKGQEEQNATHLLEEGAALRCDNLLVAAYKVDRLLHDRRRLARTAANARRLGRPYASFDIVRKLLHLQHHRSGGACGRQRKHGTCSGIPSAPGEAFDPRSRGRRTEARPNEPSAPGVQTGGIRRRSRL